MQSKDIVVGEEYAYANYRPKRGAPSVRRVKVLETGIRIRGKSLVEFKDSDTSMFDNNPEGSKRHVPNVTLIRLWSEQEVLNEARRREAQIKLEDKQRLMARRAKLVKALDDVLVKMGNHREAHGVRDTNNDGVALEALAEQGFEVHEGTGWGDPSTAFTAVTGLSKLMNEGLVDEFVVTAVVRGLR